MKTINFKANHSREIQKFIYRFEEKINKGSVKWIVSINQFSIKTLHKSNLLVILYFIGLVLMCESCAFTWIGRSVGGDIGKPQFNDYSDTRIIKVSSERINYGGRNHVEVHKTDSSVLTGIFRGFTIVPNGKNNPYKVETEFDFPVPIGLDNLNQEQIRKGVLIQLDKGQKIIIPVHEIAYARCQRGERSGKFIGTALGLLLDTAIVIFKTRDEINNITTTLDF